MKIALFSRFLMIVTFAFLFLVITVSLRAQLPHLSFNHIGVQDGLSKDDVRSIYQDKEGFMWLGSKAGIDRYDGKDFYSYFSHIHDTTKSYLQSTTGIIEDGSGGLWFINDSNGLVLMNKYTEHTVRFVNNSEDPKSLSSNKVRAIFSDSHHNIWVTTSNGGLNLFNPKDSTFSRFQHSEGDSSTPATDNLSCIAEDKNGILWISSPEGYLVKLDPVKMKFESVQIVPIIHFIYDPVIYPVLYVDRENRIWYGYFERLYIFDPKTSRITLVPVIPAKPGMWKFNFITSILEISHRNFLIATYNDGLYILNTANGRSTHYTYNPGNPFGICSNHLSGAYMSRDSVFWISSYDNGISIFSKAAQRFSRILKVVSSEDMVQSTYPVYSILQLDDGKILTGTENNGLFLFDPGTRSLEPVIQELQNTTIYDLFKHNGKIWISTWINGLYSYDLKTRQLIRIHDIPGIWSDNSFLDVVRTFVDSKNRFWFGSMSQGLLLYDREHGLSKKFSHTQGVKSGLWHNMIFKIFEDNEGDIWIGTASGLNRYDAKNGLFDQLTLSSGNEKTLGITVYDIYQDKQNQLWIATDKTLFKLNRETMKVTPFPYMVEHDIRTVFQIVSDNKDILWLGTNAGILSFDLKSEKYRDYSVSDDIRFITCHPNAGLLTKDQIVYLGSTKGLIRFEPSGISDDTIAPPVYITSITVNNVPMRISPDPMIRLNYKQNNLEISFAALHYVNPGGNHYKYMLQNFDKNWINSGNANKAIYRNLPPGDYIFRVIASNSHGYWNNEGSRVHIYISAPLYKTWIFRLAVIFLLFAAAGIVYYLRIKRLKRNQLLLEETVNTRTRELNEANVMLKDQHNKLIQQHEEISAQNDQLSQLSAEIIKQNEELEGHRHNLESLVAQRTGELEVALRKAEISDRLKSAFLANMSHEIRTPMNAIVGFANLLKEKFLNDEERNEFIDIINSNSETLLVLIDDILDLSLIEANQLTVRMDDFNLNEILDHLYSSFSLMNRNKNLNIRLNNELHELNIVLYSDRVRLNQVLTNLLSNACKFTPKGFVELGAIRKDNQLILYVQDSGIGIKKDELESVFERFRKSLDQSDTLYRGTGLGLAICKALAGLLGGTITVESELNVGSTFFLMLPWEKVSFATVPNKATGLLKSKIIKGQKEILVVEDEKANYLYAKKMLDRMNVNVHWAENGLDAVKLAASGFKYDIILMDIKMPILDGYEATKKIKAANPGQVVIAITAYARPEDRLHFMHAGFDDYISKPIKPNDFMGVINRYL